MTPLTVVGDTDDHGTLVMFKPDAEIFETVVYSCKTLAYHFRETAFPTKGLKNKPLRQKKRRGKRP